MVLNFKEHTTESADYVRDLRIYEREQAHNQSQIKTFHERLYYDHNLKYISSHFDERVTSIKKDVLLEGLFQSEKYFFNDLLKLRNYVEKNFEFVGDKFADKVRQVYYDKNTKKNIYGTTTSKER